MIHDCYCHNLTISSRFVNKSINNSCEFPSYEIHMNAFFRHWSIRCPQIHDGRSAGAHILGRYCSSIPNITSTHNKIYLWFRSDHSNARSGFALTWNSTDPGTVPVYLTVLLLLFHNPCY
jgi:hypothetical protein